jgi:death-on-curing protein
MKPLWVERQALLLLHGESLAEHGGAPGIRDEGMLESALARPKHKLEYGDPDMHDLAAAYAYGFVKNHAFIDGNKRAALLATGVFLMMNGWKLEATQAETIGAMLALADSTWSESDFAQWLRLQSVQRTGHQR